MTGAAPYTQLNVNNPVSYVLQLVQQDWIAGIISLGAVTGMMTVILVMIYGGQDYSLHLARWLTTKIND